MEKENYEELVRHSLVVDTLKIESFGRERLTSEELKQLKGVLKYLFKERIKEEKTKERKGITQNATKKAKIENFKKQWLNVHAKLTKEEQEEHIKNLELIKERSINGIELSKKEIEILRGELIELGAKKTQIKNQREEKIKEYIEKKVKEITQLSEEQIEEIAKYLKIHENSIEGLKLNETEKQAIAASIKSKLPTKKAKEEKIQEYINNKVSELTSLPEEKRESVLNNLAVKIEGFQLSEEEQQEIKEQIKSKLPAKKTKEEKIKEYINNKVSELTSLPEEERASALNNLVVEIEGLTLTEQDINDIKTALEIVLPIMIVDQEKVRNLFSESSRKINQMSHEAIQSEL